MNKNTGVQTMSHRAYVLGNMVSDLEHHTQEYTDWYEGLDKVQKGIFKDEFLEVCGEYANLHVKLSKKHRETLVIDKLTKENKESA